MRRNIDYNDTSIKDMQGIILSDAETLQRVILTGKGDMLKASHDLDCDISEYNLKLSFKLDQLDIEISKLRIEKERYQNFLSDINNKYHIVNNLEEARKQEIMKN